MLNRDGCRPTTVGDIKTRETVARGEEDDLLLSMTYVRNQVTFSAERYINTLVGIVADYEFAKIAAES